jgi:putative Mg2+ transporter-C (MgtC) family protein
MGASESLDVLLHVAPELVLKFLTAVLCGGAIGMEREMSGKPAGLRTCILICLGSGVFTGISIEAARVYGGDPTRIASQIVTGIGFLGAGAIMRQPGGGIGGLTTAAMIWFLSAIGVAIGAGYLLSSIALTAAAIIMILSLRYVEGAIRRRVARRFEFLVPHNDNSRSEIAELYEVYEDSLVEFSLTTDPNDSTHSILRFRFAGSDDIRRELVTKLHRITGLKRLRIEPRHWSNMQGGGIE